MTRYIAIVGDPASGFFFHGPFNTYGDALDWANVNLGRPFWIAELNSPEDV